MKAILTYHSIDDSGSVISLDAATFAAHAAWLARNVTVVPLAEITASNAENAVAITFDDGFQNFADHALPVLRAHGLPATVFVVSDLAGADNRWSEGTTPHVPLLPLMDWDTLGGLRAHNIEIGAHTRTHPDLRHVTSEQRSDEIAGCADMIGRRLGSRPAAFAYPYGEFDEATVHAVRASYDLACTTELRALTPQDDAARLPRLDSYYFRRPGMLEQFGSPAFKRFLWVRRHGRAVRRAFAPAGGHA